MARPAGSGSAGPAVGGAPLWDVGADGGLGEGLCRASPDFCLQMGGGEAPSTSPLLSAALHVELTLVSSQGVPVLEGGHPPGLWEERPVPALGTPPSTVKV